MNMKQTKPSNDIKETPLIKQYFEIKARYPDTVLLFRVGDFYETYGPDALIAVDILNIALTYKSNGVAGKIEMAGFPHHALDNYLPKLVRAGKRVAICDQLEDPKKAKKLVKRGVTELVTPGVSTNDAVLNFSENNFLAGLHLMKDKAGVAFLDISTGEFLTAEGSFEYVDKLLASFMPKEVLFERGKKNLYKEFFHCNASCYELDDWVYTEESATTRLTKHFHTQSLKGFGIQHMPLAIIASASLLYYMDMTEHRHLDHIQTLGRIEEDKYVRLDRYTIRSLELCHSINEGGKSLLNILDTTRTAMGSRLMRRWLLFPLKEVASIKNRQNIVDFFLRQVAIRDQIISQITIIGDLERIVSKIAVGRVSPRDVVHLKHSLQAIEVIKKLIEQVSNQTDKPDQAVQNLGERLQLCQAIVTRIQSELVDHPPIAVNRGELIRPGVHSELDELRSMSSSGKNYLQQIQEREIAETGISSLKIGYNNVFGYYIEVRNSNKDKVPDAWIRKQTLVNAERYITPELKEYEEKIIGAEERIATIESELFNALVLDLVSYTTIIQQNASIIAQLDCLLSFAEVSEKNDYHRPVVNESDVINIQSGRHPVIETQLPNNETYVANDVHLDNQSEQILMITGPNMAGKSALIRQTALIVIMAQTGCFVPAKSAEIGLVDKVFTRVGASDNISLGESTFMVEMTEASDIINNLSPKSLVLFDELGRGTSTYDGISIAWAIVEYIHEHPKCKAKTLFATHYHELNEMQKSFERIRNYHIAVRESHNKVLFLRKLLPGGSEHSFGIHVAKMAGMPQSIINRANQLLKQFEDGNNKSFQTATVDKQTETRDGIQLSFIQLDDPLLSQIRDEILHTNLDTLTPIEALNKLNDIKRLINGR